MIKNILKNSLFIAVIGLMLLTLLPPFCFAESQVDWLKGWDYRHCIILHNYTNTKLSDYQITVVNPIYVDSGLLASWHFEELDGNIAYDSSGNGKGAVVYGANLTVGKFGQGLNFNGKADYVDGGNVGLVKTIEFYIKDSNYQDGILELNSKTYISLFSGEITATGFNSPQIYVNGKLRGELLSGFNHIVITTDTAIEANAVKMGVANSDYMKGVIDEVRLYDWKLRNNDVDAHYQAKAKLNYSDLRFTDSDGITLLSYYMEKDGTFWIKVPLLDVDVNHPIYMYYGNSQADSLSDANAVFDFFEGFESQDMSKWLSSGWAVSSEGLANEGLLPIGRYSAMAKTNNAQLSRTLSLPSANMKIGIYGAVNGDLAQNYLTFYENDAKKIIWDETAGWVKKECSLGSADPVIKFVLNTDGKHAGLIDIIFAHKYVEPGVSVSIYPVSSK